MSIIHAIILGIVEGITEFLPISSTGHMILAGELLKIPSTDFVKSFEIIIQLGAIGAVVAVYWRKLFLEWGTMKKIAAAFVPTAIVGYVFYKIIKHYLLGNSVAVVGALIVGGLVILLFERFHREKENAVTDVGAITYRQAVSIGLFQCLGMFPGVSRSAATIIGGLLLGLKRQTVVEFSFLLAVPTMLAATGYDLLKSGGSFATADWAPLSVGFLVSFAVAFLSIKWLLSYIQKRNFAVFGYYRIIVAVVFWLIILR